MKLRTLLRNSDDNSLNQLSDFETISIRSNLYQVFGANNNGCVNNSCNTGHNTSCENNSCNTKSDDMCFYQ